MTAISDIYGSVGRSVQRVKESLLRTSDKSAITYMIAMFAFVWIDV